MKPTVIILLTALLLAPLVALHAADLPFRDGIQHVRDERSDSDEHKLKISP